MRDKFIGMVLVVAVAAIVWYVAAKRREHPESAAEPADAVASVEPQDAASAEPTAIVDAGAAEPDATLAESPTCAAMRAASQKYVAVAEDAGLCLDGYGELECRTSKNGATWAIRIDDVTDLEADASACATGWLERVVHVAPDGSEQTLIAPGPGGFRNGHRYNVFKFAAFSIAEVFDFDGDGEDEAVVTRWSSTFLYTFKHGRIVPYPPAAAFTIDEVKDVDGDGRPDLIVRPFGDAPTTVRLLAHALPDGAFTVRDALAVQHAQTACPRDPPLTRDEDDEHLANDVACALLWRHDAASIRTALCSGDAGPCPAWMKPMLWTKPPLTLR
ncbi:MAG TPA: VCBS repeat-containing protein [Polyangiaceae bacterium]|jgi:hypothetical protein